jgi:hypothetical protein
MKNTIKRLDERLDAWVSSHQELRPLLILIATFAGATLVFRALPLIQAFLQR